MFRGDLIFFRPDVITVIVNFCSPMRIFGGFTFEEGTWLDVNTKKPSGTDLKILNDIRIYLSIYILVKVFNFHILKS